MSVNAPGVPDGRQFEMSEKECNVSGGTGSPRFSITASPKFPPKVSIASEAEARDKGKSKRMVSHDVFFRHVSIKRGANGESEVDVSGVFSKECFHEWIANRKNKPKEPEESFRKALVAHVSGKDDRKPFSAEVEEKILARLRESNPWPCFEDSSGNANKIGERGLKRSSLGYHEAKRMKSSIKKAKVDKAATTEKDNSEQKTNYDPAAIATKFHGESISQKAHSKSRMNKLKMVQRASAPGFTGLSPAEPLQRVVSTTSSEEQFFRSLGAGSVSAPTAGELRSSMEMAKSRSRSTSNSLQSHSKSSNFSQPQLSDTANFPKALQLAINSQRAMPISRAEKAHTAFSQSIDAFSGLASFGVSDLSSKAYPKSLVSLGSTISPQSSLSQFQIPGSAIGQSFLSRSQSHDKSLLFSIHGFINFVMTKCWEQSNSDSCILARCLASFFLVSELRDLAEECIKVGISLLDSDLSARLDSPKNPKKYSFLSKEFLSPDPSKSIMKFRQYQSQYGELLLKLNGSILSSDEGCERIFQRPRDQLTGSNYFHLFKSDLQRSMFVRYVLDSFMYQLRCSSPFNDRTPHEPVAFSRMVAKTSSGNRVLLMEQRLTKERLIRCKLIDVTADGFNNYII